MKKSKNWPLYFSGLVVIGLIILVIMTGIKKRHTASVNANHDKINIVASLDSYGEMAKVVGGSHVHVTSILNKADMDPHDFEPTAETARLYQQADLVISNGGGYDTWSVDLAKANVNARKINLATLTHYQSGDNEHFWYKLTVPAQLVSKIAHQLSRLDPAHATNYMDNSIKYKKKLLKLNRAVEQVKEVSQHKAVLTTEPVYDNTLKTLKIKLLVPDFARAIDEGNDPSSATIREWQDTIKEGKVAAVIDNSQASSKLVTQAIAIAKKQGIPIVQVTETKPDGMTYIDWQLKELRALQEALQ